MKAFKERKSWIVLTLILFLFAACKGESPTAPSTTTTTTGNTPPVSSSLALTSSNTSPVVDSVVTVTATATLNNAPVPNGTAIEFQSTGGALDGGGTSIIKTTTNGVASVSLTSSSAVPVRVSATVNNVSRFVDVTFSAKPVVIPPVETIPSISSVSPSVGPPTGGQTIRINGANFRAPVRVLFDTGLPLPVEASVVAVTPTTIDVVTPNVNLGAGQQLLADIILITEVGTTTEYRVEAADAFTFRNEQLTPRISTVSPNSGGVTGGTVVKIFGDGFQAPVQVLFGTAEAKVIDVHYNEVNVVAPAARDTSPTGSGPVTGPVDVVVNNILSQTSTRSTGAFLYKSAIQITAVSPGDGPASATARVTIDGNGFVAPVTVTVAGLTAQPISVSGTRIVATVGPPQLASCADVRGPVVVTNIVNGESATGPEFRFKVAKPTIIGSAPRSVAPGGFVTVTVANAIPGINRFTMTGLRFDNEEDDTKTIFPTSSVFNNDGTATFTLAVPSNFRFQTQSCFVGGSLGERRNDIEIDVDYLNVQSGCTDTALDVFTLDEDNTCVAVPAPEFTQISPAPPGCAIAPATTVGTSSTTTIVIQNDGNAQLVITPDPPNGPNAAEFVVTPGLRTIPPGASGTFTVTFTPAAAGARTASVTLVTTDSDEDRVPICLQGNGL